MTEQDDTILIAPAEGGYTAAAPGLDGAGRGKTMAEALAEAMDAMGPARQADLRIKVREGTRVTAAELIPLLRAVKNATWLELFKLDLSNCDLHEIDLSPAALDTLGVEDSLRWQSRRGIDLWGTHSQGPLSGGPRQGAQLQGASLEDAQLQGACLWDAQLQRANLGHAQLQRAGLFHAQLQDALLGGAQLQGADLGTAQLQGAGLWHAQLQGALLGGAQLQGADLSGGDCREVDFRLAASLDGVRWHNTRLEKTWLYRRQIEPVQDERDAASYATTTTGKNAKYRAAMETYLALKTNFLSLGNYADAAWAYVKEQQMEKMAFYWEWRASGGPWRNWRGFFRWLRNWAYELLTGYGERPQMPVFWGVVTIAIFTIIFSVAGNVSARAGGPPTHDFLTALTQSIAAFATIGFNDLQPIGWGARMLTAVEAMFGIGFFALLIYTLGNRMSRS